MGLEEVKRLLLYTLVNPDLGPVAIVGPPGTGKTTAIRGLRSLLPSQEFIFACPSNCSPRDDVVCDRCKKLLGAGDVKSVERQIPFLTLPFTATSATLLGSPRKVTPKDPDLWEMFDPGIFALANSGIITVEKTAHMPKEVLDSLFSALSSSRITLQSANGRLTYPFKATPVFEYDEPKVPEIARKRSWLVARAAPLSSTEENVLAMKRVQEFELDPKGFSSGEEAAMTALKAKVARARTTLADVRPDETLMKIAKKKATAVGMPDAWLPLAQAARAAACLDDKPLEVTVLDEVTVFLQGRKGGA